MKYSGDKSPCKVQDWLCDCVLYSLVIPQHWLPVKLRRGSGGCWAGWCCVVLLAPSSLQPLLSNITSTARLPCNNNCSCSAPGTGREEIIKWKSLLICWIEKCGVSSVCTVQCTVIHISIVDCGNFKSVFCVFPVVASGTQQDYGVWSDTSHKCSNDSQTLLSLHSTCLVCCQWTRQPHPTTQLGINLWPLMQYNTRSF